MRITIKDLAKDAGVSPATVSYVINNGPRTVHPQTRERVLASIRRLDYHPSAVARGLSSKRMNTLGVFVNYWEIPVSNQINQYLMSVLNGILAAAQRRKQIIALFMDSLWADGQNKVSVFCDGRCDGLLLAGLLDNSPIVATLKQQGVPFVLVNDVSEDPDVSWVDVDNVGAACAMTDHLLAQGHRRIAILCGNATISSTVLRHAGYQKALATAGIACDPTLILPGIYSIPSGYERTLELMRRPIPLRPTALFCSSDDIAFGAMQALQELELRVPQNVSVVGFDDLPSAANTQPPLTTVRQPLRALGEHAVELLLAQIEGTAPTGQKEVLPTELIIRASVAPPLDTGLSIR